MTWCRVGQRAEQLHVIAFMPMKTWRQIAMAKAWCTTAKPLGLFILSYGASSQWLSTNGTRHTRRSCWTCLMISLQKRLAIKLFAYTQWNNRCLVSKLLQGHIHKECTVAKIKGIKNPRCATNVTTSHSWKGLKSSTPLHWINASTLQHDHM